MKTKEIKLPVELFISATPNKFGRDGTDNPFIYEVHSCDITGLDHRSEDILLHTVKTSVILPEGIDLIEKSVDALQEKKEKLQAEYHVNKTAIEDKIANLLALEYKPDQES